MKIIVLGGDGFCGWPTVLRLARSGCSVLVVDNLSRRNIDNELSSRGLTNIYPIKERIDEANKIIGDIQFCNIDIALQPTELRDVIRWFRPRAVVHFAEQRSAPYSMLGDKQRRYTVDNNVAGTSNLCSAILEVDSGIHIVHLGTMGVYGYNKDYGAIPEGYLDVTINQTNNPGSILYPANPGSIYHMTKCLDQLIFQFYNKNWGLKITDLHQGIVWGIDTEETKMSEVLSNRFDYDGIYGTVLNRFIVQAANGVPLSVYGTGGQKRAFINISDTATCVRLAIENDEFDVARPRIFNQVSEVHTVKDLAYIIRDQYGASVQFVDNPRNEPAENDLEVSNEGLKSLGFEPILLHSALADEVIALAKKTATNFNPSNVLSSPRW